jgi:hypothetical protein
LLCSTAKLSLRDIPADIPTFRTTSLFISFLRFNAFRSEKAHIHANCKQDYRAD